MTPTSSARKADQEATMTQDADAGGRWQRDGRTVYRAIEEPMFILGVESDAVALERLLNVLQTARREAEQERDRLQRQVQELSDILADRYEVYGKESARAERFKVALETIKQRAGRLIEGKDKAWFTQNAYAVADFGIREGDALTPTHESEAT